MKPTYCAVAPKYDDARLGAPFYAHAELPNALPELKVLKELDPHHKPVPASVPEMEIFD